MTRTRRQLFREALAASGALAALSALGPLAASAQERRPERVGVLLEHVGASGAEQLARGQGRGVEVVAENGRAALRSRGGAFVSAAVELPLAATHVGLHWNVRASAPEAVAVAVRTSADGRRWSEWEDVDIEAVAPAAAGRTVYAALVGADRARFVQYRAAFPEGDTATVEGVTVAAINSVDGPRLAATAAPTSTTVTTPDGKTVAVTTRAGWGCDEALRFRGAEIWPEMYVPAKRLVVHHTATSNNYRDGAAEVRAIYAYHAMTLGWGDIGYHALVDRFGNVYEGRHGRGEDPAAREVLSTGVVAGHVYRHNYGSAGVAALGNFERTKPSAALLTALEDVATYECGRNRIDPAGASLFLQSDDRWHRDGAAGPMNNVSGHHESEATACPGKNLKSWLPTLRANTAARLRASVGGGAPQLSGPGELTTLTAPATLSFAWSAGVTSYCLEGWARVAGGEDVTYLSGYGDEAHGAETAKVQRWTATDATTATGATFPDLAPGHYTIHVRAAGGFEANRTYLVR